jgi:hypothetical protein
MNECLFGKNHYFFHLKIHFFKRVQTFPAIKKKGQNLGRAEFDGTKIV